MIFSVLPCMSSQQFAATKLLRHNYTLQCGMMRNLLGGKLLFMTGEEPSLQWCLSFHLLSVDFVKWNTCVLVQHTSTAVMSCCMTDLQVWMMKLGHCSLLNSNKTTHSTRLVWANYVEHESLYVGRKLFSVVVLLFADLLVVCQNYAMLDPEKKKHLWLLKISHCCYRCHCGAWGRRGWGCKWAASVFTPVHITLTLGLGLKKQPGHVHTYNKTHSALTDFNSTRFGSEAPVSTCAF